MKYFAEIKGMGKEALESLEDPETNFIVIFNENVPDFLADMCILHSIGNLEEEIKAGDKLIIHNKEFEVTSVGSEANGTLDKLGHCTISFQGTKEAPMPGYISVKGDEVLSAKDLRPGSFIKFL